MQQDKDHQKNLLLAIVLSVAVLLGWQMFYAGPKLKEEQERRQRIQQEQTQVKEPPGAPKTGPVAAPGAAPQPSATTPSSAPAAPAPTREAALAGSPRLAVETPSLKGSIALRGGRIDDLVLVRYHETVDPKSPNVVLFSPSGAPHPYYAEYGWSAGGGSTQPMPNADTLWKPEKEGPLTPAAPATLVWDNGQGLVFRRTIAVDDNYLFTVTDAVENKTGAPVVLHPYGLISRHGMPKVEGYYILHEGLIGVLGDKGLQELTYADVLKEGGTKPFKQIKGGWLGITDKYWAAALIPDQQVSYNATLGGVKDAGRERFQTDYLQDGITVPGGGTAAAASHLFAGAKQMSLIEAYREKPGAKQFDLLIDWGWFYFITKPLFKLLHWLSQVLGNYGLAILATTVLVKAAFFPLANKSYESMAKMKKLQPEMEKIRDRYKDDRVKQQQELMALYKNEKINPMSGCLPIVLQIPVFFALYKVLFVTIDMRHAPFFGWIRDLSAPDPTSLFNLFGLLPYHVPDMLHVGVWPMIMGVTMWVQMQLNPQQPDPVQQKIFNWMPVIFTFMLASFPSGLVIYWAWNNVLSLIQQYAIMRKNNTEIHLWKNLGADKWKARMQAAKGLDVGKLKERVASASGKLPQSVGKALKRGGGAAVGPAANDTKAASDGRSGASAEERTPMTREQALEALGLAAGASDREIDAALAKASKGRPSGMNGSDHAIAARLDAAREILRGKEGT
jgi:YidC/Oxa1 family membrane protein insertase